MTQMLPFTRLVVTACLFSVGGFIYFLYTYAGSPITDPDFWWHLKTGDVILQQGGILQNDLFAFTGDEFVSSREKLILNGYWLWQIVVSGLYSALGFSGIILFNFVIASSIVLAIAYEMKRLHVDWAIAFFLLVLGVLLFGSIYPLERPQIISFLFTVILVGMLFRTRDGGHLGAMLPVLMVTWANMHGGFLVGDLILLCFAVGVVIEYRHDHPRMKQLLGWVCIGVFASLLNPNFGIAFSETLTLLNSEQMSGIGEYRSTLKMFQDGHWLVCLHWLLIISYAAAYWVSGRRFWPELCVAIFLACFSVLYSRNIGFFSLAMLPAIGFHLQQIAKPRRWRITPVVGVFLFIVAGMYFWWQGIENWQRKALEGSISQFFPEDSSNFILSSGLQGRMFNSYTYGGYQLWRLYPQHQVFIDGRGLDADVFHDWKLISSASLKELTGRNEFEVLLDSYGIDYVVQPHFFLSTGRLTPLVKFLLVKPEWIPVYIDSQSYILVRASEKNADVIERFKIDKRNFNDRLIAYLSAACNDRPTEVIYRVSLVEMLIFVGLYAEAEKHLLLISKIEPNNSNLGPLRNQLEIMRNDTH
jgi:hypothetical protein